MEFDFIRILLAFFSGYFLSISGSLSQLTTHNKIASPSTLGFDGFAVLMVLLAQLIFLFIHPDLALETISFILFLFLFLLLFLKTKKIKKSNHVENKMDKVILLGIGFNLFIGAIFSIVQFLFMSMNMQFPSGIWFGSFRFFEQSTVVLFFVIFIICQLDLLKHGKELRLISIGIEFAEGLGINILKVQRRFLLISLFLTGLVIVYFGVFSFLGLIFPHLLRLIPSFKYNIKKEIIYGPYITGVILSGLDILCYNFTFYGAEIPVGMVSSVLGSFLLILLLVKKQKTA